MSLSATGTGDEPVFVPRPERVAGGDATDTPTRTPRTDPKLSVPQPYHFEGRSFLGWHRHVTLAVLAQAFCNLLRLDPKAAAPA